jgi:hypothetical protein
MSLKAMKAARIREETLASRIDATDLEDLDPCEHRRQNGQRKRLGDLTVAE